MFVIKEVDYGLEATKDGYDDKVGPHKMTTR
jgi:hypothetical protein